MSQTRIKICGIKTPETLDAALAGRASHIGLNFYAPSPRYADPKTAAALAARAAGNVTVVGLFVDPVDAVLEEVLSSVPLGAVQLHGEEAPARLAEIRSRFGLPVWKALPIKGREDLERARDFVGAADFLLLDAKTPKGALPGGMGLTFDWNLLSGWKPPLPWGLAGGLVPGNVADAIQRTAAPLVDVSSGVESAPGVKDPALIAAFCTAVRAA